MTLCYSSLQNNDTEHKKEFVSILQFILIPNLPPTVNGNPKLMKSKYRSTVVYQDMFTLCKIVPPPS